MIIAAKFASVCPCCSDRIAVGAKVEWSRGEKARHVACSAAPGARIVATAPARVTSTAPRGRNWDSSKFNGYGAARGGHRKACVSGGNCSSIGSGRSCGGHDCDGF